MSIRLILSFTLLCLSVSAHDTLHELFEKYSHHKIFESCFGERLIEAKYKEFYGHVEACRNGSSSAGSSYRTGFDWKGALSSRNNDGSPLYLPVPILTNNRENPFFRSRSKRHAFFSEEKLRGLKSRVLRKLKTASCVMQRMGIFDQELNLKWNVLESYYKKDMGLDMELKEDLSNIFNKCKNFVSCMPIKSGSFPMGFKQFKFFNKCTMKKKLMACLKKDLRKKPEMFELQGLDGMLDDYVDDDEKMLKVLLLTTKYGDDDDAEFFTKF